MKSFASFMNTFKTIKPLSNIDIISKCKELPVENFKGVFMRDELKGNVVNGDECLIMNIDESSNDGTHWTCLLLQIEFAIISIHLGFLHQMKVIDIMKICR